MCGCAATGQHDPVSKTVKYPVSKTVKSGVFMPTFQSPAEDKYHDAGEIYDSAAKVPQGLYHHDGLVFVIICIDTGKENIEYPEGTAMLRTVAMLREHYTGLPQKFYIRHRVLEKEFDEDTGIYRYATVYREKDITRKIRK